MKQNEFCHSIDVLKDKIEHSDYIVIGAGSGLSTAAGLTYDGKRFTDNFHPFIDKYGITDMYSAGFYPYPSAEEKWAYWAKHVLMNRYEIAENGLHKKLYELFKDKNYFVLTTNVDGLFEKAGFDTNRIFATQGDYKYFQCKKACHNKLYNNESQVRTMVSHTENCKIPSSQMSCMRW
jgi:NAD-dependent SIR2 family protein deacetylase